MDQERLDAPLFRPYEKLVEITIRDQKLCVPENNLLLRAFQFLCMEPISYGRYCWNEECQYCRVAISRPGDDKQHQALSCKTMVEEGMVIHELSTELAWNLSSVLRPASKEPVPPETR